MAFHHLPQEQVDPTFSVNI